MAIHSNPVTVAPGKIQVTVTLPKLQNKQYSGFSRDAQLAKWAAAKAAIIQLREQSNEFIPEKHRNLYQHYKEKRQ